MTKEFFILLIKEILNPDFGMFIENSESYKIWFAENSLETEDMYSLIGNVLILDFLILMSVGFLPISQYYLIISVFIEI